MALGTLLVISQLAAGSPSGLVAAAAASTRPPECVPFEVRPGVRGASVWRRARLPRLARFCQLLARSEALLDHQPQKAAEVAQKAEALLPKRPGTRVLLARAALRNGKATEALKHFAAALALDEQATNAPLALRDLARAQLRGGLREEALASYRRLAPVATLLAGRAMRGQVLLEAAHVALASGAEAATDEALAYLREAGRDRLHPLDAAVTLTLVWALDRQGKAHRADAVLSEHPGAGRYRGEGADHMVQLDDALALEALAAAGSPTRARELWSRYLASSSVPEDARRAAEARKARLGKAKKKKKKKKRRRRPR